MLLRAPLLLALLAFAAGCSPTSDGGTGGGSGSTGGSSGTGGSTGTGGGSSGTGGGSSGTGGGSGTVDADAVCTAWADKMCNKLESCSSFMVRGLYGDLATCKARAKVGCVPWFGAPGSAVTAAGTERCGDAFAAMSCDDVENNVNPIECRVFGSFANGATCGDSAQCQSGHCSITQGLCGTCKTRQQAGGFCDIDSNCERGLICNGGICFAPGGTGAPCNMAQPCKNTHACVNGQCQRYPTVFDAPCDVNVGCDNFLGLWCNFQTARCDYLQLVASGTCGYNGNTFTLCSRAADCSIPQGQMLGQCVSPANDGQTCTTAAPGAFSCFSPGQCISGRCTLPSATFCQ